MWKDHGASIRIPLKKRSASRSLKMSARPIEGCLSSNEKRAIQIFANSTPQFSRVGEVNQSTSSIGSRYSGRAGGGPLRPSVRLVLKRNAFHVRSVTSKFALRVLSCVHGEHTKRDS